MSVLSISFNRASSSRREGLSAVSREGKPGRWWRSNCVCHQSWPPRRWSGTGTCIRTARAAARRWTWPRAGGWGITRCCSLPRSSGGGLLCKSAEGGTDHGGMLESTAFLDGPGIVMAPWASALLTTAARAKAKAVVDSDMRTSPSSHSSRSCVRWPIDLF